MPNSSPKFTLKESPNDVTKDLWKSSSCHTNIQYDVYKSKEEVPKRFLFSSRAEDKLQHHLTSQGFFFPNVFKYSLSSVNSLWSEVQSHLPKNIYKFTIRYINNSLPTLKNMARWGLSQSPDCSFCLNHSCVSVVVVNSTVNTCLCASSTNPREKPKGTGLLLGVICPALVSQYVKQ